MDVSNSCMAQERRRREGRLQAGMPTDDPLTRRLWSATDTYFGKTRGPAEES